MTVGTWNGPTHPPRASVRPRNPGSVVPVRAAYSCFRASMGFDMGLRLTITATLVDSDVDTQSSNTRHKPSTLPFEKRSTDDTRRGTEPSSNGRLTISPESPRSKFRVAGQVDLISAAGSGAKILLNIAKESADAFGPLKSVLGGISAICNQYEVCFRTPVPRVICS